MAKTAGPYDQYRNQKPPDVPQDKWDAYIDQMNAEYETEQQRSQGVDSLFGGSTFKPYPVAGQNTTTVYPTKRAVGSTQGSTSFTNQFRDDANKPSDMASIARAGAIKQIGDVNARNAAENRKLIDTQIAATDRANAVDDAAIGSFWESQQQARAGYQGIANNVRNDARAANDLSAQLFGGYAQGQGALNAQDMGSLDRYINETNPLMTQLTARGSDPADVQRQLDSYSLASGIAGGSLDYSAAQYSSNPADVARQQQMYNTLLGVGSGSLDYQADQYESNPADIAAQQRALQDFRNVSQGELDYKSKAAQAYAGKDELANQNRALQDIRADLLGGSADQRQVMEKFKALSDPTVTAKERFLSELARREFESADKSSRDAQSENLAMRGLRSGGLQIAQQQATRQQLAQDRLLKELGIQAQAVDRSMQALGGWGTAANSIRAGDQNALNMQAGLTTSMRNASFDEAYKRGLGADQASRDNQAVRFAGYQGAANQTNQIRNANDAVGMFNTHENNVAYANNQATRLSGYQGAAAQSNAIRDSNDRVGMFNTEQTNIASANNQQTRMQGATLQASQSNAIRSANDSVRQFQDTYAQNEATRVGNLAGQRHLGTLNTTAQMGQRQTNVHDAGQRVIDTAYGRDMDVNQTDWNVVDKDYGMSKDYFDVVTQAGDRRVGRAVTNTTTIPNVTKVDADNLAEALGLSVNQWPNLERKSLADSGW